MASSNSWAGIYRNDRYGCFVVLENIGDSIGLKPVYSLLDLNARCERGWAGTLGTIIGTARARQDYRPEPETIADRLINAAIVDFWSIL